MSIGYVYVTRIKMPGKTDKWYVGGRYTNPENDENYFGSGKKIQQYIKKYGTKYLTKYVLVKNLNTQELKEAERRFIKRYKQVYGKRCLNMRIQGNSAGYTQPLETRKRMSKAQTKEKNNFYGRKHTEESKEKMRVAKLGVPISPQAKKKRCKFDVPIHEVYARIPQQELPFGRKFYIACSTFYKAIQHEDDKWHWECLRLFEKYK